MLLWLIKYCTYNNTLTGTLVHQGLLLEVSYCSASKLQFWNKLLVLQHPLSLDDWYKMNVDHEISRTLLALLWPKILMALPWPKIFMAFPWPKIFMALPWPKIVMALPWPKVLYCTFISTKAFRKFW